MSDEKTVTLLGEGGVQWTFALPLTETMLDQVDSGLLQPADEESAALLDAELGGGPVDDEDGEPDTVEVSDAAGKLADAEGIDLTQVEGTGAHGNIMKGDVEKAIADRDASLDANPDDEDGEPDQG